MDAAVTEQVKLAADNGTVFTVLRSVAERSKTVRDLIEQLVGEGKDPASDVIPLGSVGEKSLRHVVDWCVRHADDPEAKVDADAKPSDMPDLAAVQGEAPKLPEADKAQFDTMETDDIFALILASNYLDIPPLLQQCCQTVANKVLGKTPKEIYAMFNVTEELTPEEEEEVRKENPWLEDQ